MLSKCRHVIGGSNDCDEEIEAHVQTTHSNDVAFVEKFASDDRKCANADLSWENDLEKGVEPRAAVFENVELKGPRLR